MARPREFDRTHVLDQAMRVFWEHGYDGASISALTSSMGINSPSLYMAFGSKEALFQEVLHHYHESREAHRVWTSKGRTAREVAERMLYGSTAWLTDPAEPKGCLLVQCSLASKPTGKHPGTTPADRHAGIASWLSKRFAQGQREGDLDPAVDTRELGSYIYSIFCGLAIRAAAGESQAALKKTVDRAMLAWPSNDQTATRKKLSVPGAGKKKA